MKGHRNSKGELAEWVIKSHETGEILSSHKSEKKAKEHLQHMHIFGESVEGEAACSHCGCSTDGVEEYNGRLLCPYCLKEFQRLDACRDANGYVKYDNITSRSDGFNPEGYKLIGESTYGTDMDKRVQIFMEGVSQLGLSKNQVDAIGKITNACMEGVDMDGEQKDGPDITDNFVTDAFYRAVSRLLVKYPNRLYEDKVAGVIGDKITGKKFSIYFDPRCHMIEVRTKDDRKTYPLWVNKSKSMNLLIELIMDIFSEELENTDNTTSDADVYEALYPDEGVDYGRHVRTSEDEYDPENPEDPDDDIFYDGNGRVNEQDPDEEPAEF